MEENNSEKGNKGNKDVKKQYKRTVPSFVPRPTPPLFIPAAINEEEEEDDEDDEEEEDNEDDDEPWATPSLTCVFFVLFPPSPLPVPIPSPSLFLFFL